ncbi:hypothetical protein AALA21_02160 [Eggerthellaceae bacterium 3-80]|nr:hypothetical protein D7W09_00110 [bacterium D16-34]
MKACPVCQAISFDDAQVCYECMHPFDKETSFAGKEEQVQLETAAPITSSDVYSSTFASQTLTADPFSSKESNCTTTPSVLELKIPLKYMSDLTDVELDDVGIKQQRSSSDGWEIRIQLRNRPHSLQAVERAKRKGKKKAKRELMQTVSQGQIKQERMRIHNAL